MTSLEKNKKKKKAKQKKAKKKENETEVLERVMDSIEMAGASLEFFDQDLSEQETAESTESAMAAEVEESAADEVLEAQTDSDVQEIEPEIDIENTEEGETLEMLPEEDSSLEFIEQKQAFSILESLLFSSDRALGLGTFKQVFKGTNFKTKEIKAALEELQSEYADPTRGVSLEEINGGWQLRTKVDNMDF